MKLLINKNNFLKSVVVIYIILISGAWSIEINAYIRLIINTILGLYSLATLLKKGQDKKGVNFVLAMTVLLTVSMIINVDFVGWRNYVSLICFICFGLYVYDEWGIRDFAKRYCNWLCVISVISLICYVFRDFLYQFSSGLPIVQGHSVSYINYFIYLYCREAPYRNCAIFWEPGAFAVFIGIAILFSFSYLDEKSRNRQLIIYILSLITTGSTLAYTLILLTMLIYMLQSNKGGSKLWRVLIGVVGLITIVFILEDIGALQNINDKLFQGLETNASSRGRYIGQLADLRLIASNPITGVGTSSYTDRASAAANLLGYYWGVSANTYTSMGAMFGAPLALISIYGLVRFYYRKGFLLKVIFIFFGLWIFVTEAFIFKPILYVLIMGGLSSIREDIEYQKQNEIYKENSLHESV